MLASEGCSRWEKQFHYGVGDQDDDEEEDHD
jgi:hypothetical protein